MTNARKKVLVVEDDDDVRLGLELVLQGEYDVVQASDGATAMMVARREIPDIILLDLGIPAGDGLHVLEWMRDLPTLTFTPKIVLTGRDGDVVEREALARGASMVLRKPAEPAQVRDALRLVSMWPAGRRWHFLVVEDDDDLRAGLALQLQARGLVVTTATDGVSALSAARRTLPDAIVLDLGLPVGDGFKVLERLRAVEELADIPVVVLSGQDPGVARERALAAGANAFVSKPAETQELLGAVGILL